MFWPRVWYDYCMFTYLSRLFLAFTSLLAFLGALVYLAIGLTTFGIFLTVAVAIIATAVFAKKFPYSAEQPLKTESLMNILDITLFVGYVILFIAGIIILFASRSDRPLITPWEIMPDYFFAVYALATVCLLFLAAKSRSTLALIAAIAHYLLSFSVALIVYRIGYGYDPFIHQAAVKAIEELGRIYPTTFYYLGQYSLVTVAHHLFGQTIAFWDKLLVPALAAVTLPTTIFYAWHKQLISSSLVTALLLLFPFSLFIITTPQNLAYLFLIAAIIWSLGEIKKSDLAIIWLLALAALVTQPIAGLPAIFFAISASGQIFLKKQLRISLHIILAAGYVVMLPAALYIFSRTDSSSLLSLQWPQIAQLFSFLTVSNPVSEAWWFNWLYLYKGATGIILALFIVRGAYLSFKVKNYRRLIGYGLPAAALTLSAIIASTINFHFLIDYERSDYPERILLVAALFSLPFILDAMQELTSRILAQSVARKIIWLAIGSAAITASLYLSYPRFDHYANSHGYATSKADMLAVHWIAEDAGATDYIVLSNQQVSAASLREFGFKKYYANNLFYYPIPTGGPLYQYYLQMVEKPKKETMAQAMDLAGVTTAYFVLDEYWWQSDRLAAEARLLADRTQVISDGQVTVFRFDR